MSEKSIRKTISDSLKKYDYHSNSDDDFIEVTEWSNGEGYDIMIESGTYHKAFSLTDGELQAVRMLTDELSIYNKQYFITEDGKK